ncbi:MAG: DinB family protein [Actinomycetota bacterium]
MDDGSGPVNGRRGGVAEAAHLGDERTALMGFLQRQRDLVAWKVRDASDETLRSVHTASGLTIPGVIRHLENVERSWFRDVFAGEADLSFDWTDEEPDREFHPPDDVPVAALLAAYAAEQVRCDVVIDAAWTLDQVSATRGFSLRWILVHMIEETGRHLGHLDLLRELADGEVGEDPG